MSPLTNFSRAVFVALATILFSSAALAADLNMPVGVTDISRETHNLHMIIIIICCVIGAVVYGVLAWSLIKYRKSKGAKAASWHENTTVEIAWTLVPLLILIVMAIPSTKVLRQIYNTEDAVLDVMITGYQWRWQYEYLDESGDNIRFMSTLSTSDEEIYNLVDKNENYLLEVDNPLIIPVGQKVRFLITAADVIHSWWVPEFAVKKDAVPGIMNEAWVIAEEPGIYRGQCTELCGQDHGFMPIEVHVLEQEEFDAWYAESQAQAVEIAEMASQEWTLEQLVAEGETVYNTYCMACHQQNGEGLAPAFPSLVGTAVSTGPIEGHIDVVLNGVQGTAMAAYGSQLNPVQLAAVITYERNAWGNDMGDMVTPVEILEAQQ